MVSTRSANVESVLSRGDTQSTFLTYYPNRHQSIRKHFDARHWVSLGRYTYLKDEQIVEAVDGSGGAFRGLRWGDKTRFAVLDIDKDSEYHNPHSLKRISKTLSEVGLDATCKYQSSLSGGWHLYIPFGVLSSSTEVETLLKTYLKSSGYKVISGQLEVFPSNNGLRLPLQEGFAWLADDGSIAVRREDLSTEHAIRKFVLDMEIGANNWEYTKSRINQVLQEHRLKRQKELEIERQLRLSTEGMDELFQGRVIQENYDSGRKFFQEGLKSNGERHDAVICVEHYFWHGDDSIGLRPLAGRANDYDRYEAILSWLQKKHNGCCNHINRGDWKTVESQIKRAVNWRCEEVPERTPYVITSDRALDRIISLTKSTGRTWTPEDWQKANDRRKKRARRKIEEAVEELVASGEKISIRKVALVSGCHRSTVSKHRDLLPSGLSDLEPGGVGGSGSQQNDPTSSGSSLVLPSSFVQASEFSSVSGDSVFPDLSAFDPPVSVSSDLSLSEVAEDSHYIQRIACLEDSEDVISIAPGSLVRKEKKEALESLRIVVFENGQLAIDFSRFGISLVRRRKVRGPP